jgi:hypothetical protein
MVKKKNKMRRGDYDDDDGGCHGGGHRDDDDNGDKKKETETMTQQKKIFWLEHYHQMSRTELLQDQRSRAIHLYPYLFSILDPRLQKLFQHWLQQDPTTTHFPAVDLAAGEAVATLLLALRYRKTRTTTTTTTTTSSSSSLPTNNNNNNTSFAATLDWYPTEYTGTDPTVCNPLEDILRTSLRTMAHQGNQDNFLFFDWKSGAPVYKQDKVQLEGIISSPKELLAFNGQVGIIQHQDPLLLLLLANENDNEEEEEDTVAATATTAIHKNNYCYGVKMESHDRLLSIPAKYIVSLRRPPPPPPSVPSSACTTTTTTSSSTTTTTITVSLSSSSGNTTTSSSISTSANSFFDQLLERSCEINLVHPDTWTNLTENPNIRGRCALVTCTYLLTSIGAHHPTVWQETLQLASQLLRPGGYLLQYDTTRYTHTDDDGNDKDSDHAAPSSTAPSTTTATTTTHSSAAGFGNESVLQAYAVDHALDLSLEHCSEPLPESGGSLGRIVVVLWKKEDGTKN